MSHDPFDDKAATWDDDPAKVARAAVVATQILESVPVHASARVLEYGAGTGLVTQALRASVGPVTLADTSRGMREAIEAKVQAGDLADARVWDVDLETQDAPAEEFDLIVTVLVLHHIHDVARVLRSFHALLAPGGHLCVADLAKEDGSFHGADFAGHQGFDRDGLEADLRRAGFHEVRVDDCTELERDGRSYPVFLAIAER